MCAAAVCSPPAHCKGLLTHSSIAAASQLARPLAQLLSRAFSPFCARWPLSTPTHSLISLSISQATMLRRLGGAGLVAACAYAAADAAADSAMYVRAKR